MFSQAVVGTSREAKAHFENDRWTERRGFGGCVDGQQRECMCALLAVALEGFGIPVPLKVQKSVASSQLSKGSSVPFQSKTLKALNPFDKP
jgi:hypothetical protein